MKKLFLICAIPLFLATPSFAAMSQADCEAMWKKADMNTDGSLDPTEAKMYTDAMMKANMTTTDASKLTSTEFMKACQAGAFDSMKM